MLYCLSAAALWAISLSMYRGPITDLGARAANLFKCTFAALLYWAWILAFGPGGSLGGPRDWTFLAISGVVGLTIGDLLLFLAVREGGVQRALVLFNTSPLIAAVIAIPLLGEMPKPAAWIGMALVLAGVALVETDPRRVPSGQPAGSRRAWLATAAGLGAAAGQAGGILFSRGPLKVIPVLPATAMRLTAAIAVLVPLLAMAAPDRGFRSVAPRHWKRMALPTLLGTVIALLLSMHGIRDLEAGTAASLLATTPIFALPISRFVLKEPLGPRSIAGSILAVVGVALLGQG